MKKQLLAAMVGAMALSSSLTVSAAPATMRDGTIFDAEYYAQQNPDVVAAFGTNTNALYSHYTRHGKAEGRMAHMNDTYHMTAPTDGTFDASYYAQQNPDVVAALGTDPNMLYSHYVNHGRAEGRKSHINDLSHVAVPTTTVDTTFDANYYAQQNPDVVAAYGTNSNALYSHYSTHGKSEGRRGHE